MILQINSRLVNAFIEPQFAEPGMHQLVTVQFYHFEKLKEFRRSLDGDLRLNIHDRYFPFTGYTSLESLWLHAKRLRPTFEDLLVKKNISPAPAAFKWVGIKHEVEEWEEDAEVGQWWGFCLPDEVMEERMSQDISYDEFLVYPLFELPEELARTKLTRG